MDARKEHYQKFQKQNLMYASYITLAGTSRKLFTSSKHDFLLIIMTQILEKRTETEHELILETQCDETVSSNSENELHEDTIAADNNNMTQPK